MLDAEACSMTLSARTCLKGTVEEAILGDVLAHISVRDGERTCAYLGGA